ncbi:MAG: NfeD family protein [Planctomycetota bacterium]|jgi:membrane-bound serine protease (ClpP class)
MAQRYLLLCLIHLCLLGSVLPLQGQEQPSAAPAAAGKTDLAADESVPADAETEELDPVARYITVNSPVNQTLFTRIRNTLVKLQHQAELEQREAILILDLQPGISMFGQVRDLAKELTSTAYPNVRTIAWIDHHEERPIDGYVAIVALACQEIVMHPDAEFGDIGRGKPLDDDERLSVVNMVEKRHNRKVNAALATGLVDPTRVLHRIKLESAAEAAAEIRVVTDEELRTLQESDVAILAVETFKEKGDALLLSGRRARALDILVSQTAEDRVDLADLYGFERMYLREDVTGGEAPTTRLIRLEGVIDPILHEFASREIRRAVADRANLIIFEIESPGGYLLDSEQLADEISQLDPKQHRTVAYIPDHALSGAAIIALGCDEIYLHPEATIGDAGPIEIRPGEPFERAPEKVLSELRETLKVLAERKNRPPALVEAMADKDLKVFQATHAETGRVWYMSETEIDAAGGEWVKGPLVTESRENNLLTLNGRRAHELKIAGEPVDSFDDLKQRIGVPQDEVIPAAQQTWVDTLVTLLKSPGATFLLFLVGMFFIYLEMHTTSGFFGIGAALCFSIFFWSRFLGGTADWLEIVLFVFGAVLIAIEIFVIPGFGIFGLAGGAAVISSLILASQTFVIPSSSEEFVQLSWSLGTLSSAIVVVVIGGMVMSHFLPRIPGIRNLILAPQHETAEGPKLDPALAGSPSRTAAIEQDTALIGQTGEAFTTLRPSGRARIGGNLVDVVAEGAFLEPGTPLEVIDVAGNRVIVRPLA